LEIPARVSQLVERRRDGIGRQKFWNLKKKILLFIKSFQNAKYLSATSGAGLPEFSLHNIPIRGEIFQIATKLSNGHYINIPNCKNIS
jgi:hypothetical protein